MNPKRNSESNRSTSSGQVKASRSDFLADVELCAVQVLNKRELFVFHQIGVLHYIPEQEEVFVIADKLGPELKRREIYPLKQYFLSKHVTPREGKTYVNSSSRTTHNKSREVKSF